MAPHGSELLTPGGILLPARMTGTASVGVSFCRAPRRGIGKNRPQGMHGISIPPCLSAGEDRSQPKRLAKLITRPGHRAVGLEPDGAVWLRDAGHQPGGGELVFRFRLELCALAALGY